MLLILARKEDGKVVELFCKAPATAAELDPTDLFVIEACTDNGLAGGALLAWRRRYGLLACKVSKYHKEPLDISLEQWLEENPQLVVPKQRPRRYLAVYDPFCTDTPNAFIEWIWSPFDGTWKYRKI